MTPHGHFHWNELMSNDVEKAKTFYHNTLGWNYSSTDMGPGGTYWIIMDGEKSVGGMYQMSGPNFEGMKDQWTPYIAVDDVDKRVIAAQKAGATIIQQPFDIPNAGRISMLMEPGGAMIGWMTQSNS